MTASLARRLRGGVEERLPALLHAGFALAILNLLALNVGGLGAESYRFLGVLLLLTWVVVAHRHFDLGRLRGLPGLLLIALLLLHFRCESQLALTVSASAVLAVTCSLLRAEQLLSARTLPQAAALHAVLATLFLSEPSALLPLRAAALSWCAWLGEHLLGQPLALGHTPLGFWVALPVVCLLLARFALLEWRPLSLVSGLACVLAAQLVYVVSLEVLPASVLTRGGLTIAPLICFAAAIVPVGLLVGSRLISPLPPAGPLTRAMACSVAAASLLALGLQAPLVRSAPSPSVVFYSVNEGPILNWERPEHGRYGRWSQGMFGLLPEYLAADGFEVELLRERVRPEHLAGRDALVTINVNTDWTAEELQTIWRFVHAGGRLLVLGDHTDVEGSRASQNALLAPAGIGFGFDAALPSPLNGWTGTDLFAHGIHAGIASAGDLGLGVGASLTLADGDARPIVACRSGLADLGDMSAPERAFLGDYEYQLGEQFGDLVLVADRAYGQGRFLVFGDTSSFQNPALVGGYPFVHQVFAWLTGEVLFDVGDGRHKLVALAGAAALAALWLLRQRPGACALVPVALFAAWSGSAALQSALLEGSRPELPMAFLDLSHGPRVDFSYEGRNTIGGLVTNLQRSGFAVTPLRTFDEAPWRRGDVFVSIAPTSAYTPSEVEALIDFMGQGGLLLLAVGHREKGPVQRLLDAVDLDIGDAPVGPVPLHRLAGRARLGVEYVEAWPILIGPGDGPPDRPSTVAAPAARLAGALAAAVPELTPRLPERRATSAEAPRVEVFGRYQDVPLAVRARVGDGALFLVADSCFFDSDNLEHEDQVSLPNILFLRQVLDDHRRRTEAP